MKRKVVNAIPGKKKIDAGLTSVTITETSEEDQFFERRIITGLIMSTEYIKQFKASFDTRLLCTTAQTLAYWCLVHILVQSGH